MIIKGVQFQINPKATKNKTTQNNCFDTKLKIKKYHQNLKIYWFLRREITKLLIV